MIRDRNGGRSRRTDDPAPEIEPKRTARFGLSLVAELDAQFDLRARLVRAREAIADGDHDFAAGILGDLEEELAA